MASARGVRETVRVRVPSAASRPHNRSGGMTCAALYVRVSTREQTVENQDRELRDWAERLGVEGVRI